MSAPVPPPPADTAAPCCGCICDHQCTKDPTVIGHQGCVACKWCSCWDHPAAGERIPPLTAQQLGLCGPLSDDPGVGPDAARHTPPADDQDAYLADAEGLCRSRTLPGDARGALDVLLAEYDRRGTELARMDVRVQQGANSTSWAAREAVGYMRKVDDLADQRDVLSGLLRGMARRVGRNRASEVRIVTALRAVVDSLHDENAVLRGEKPHAAAVIDRMREQARDIKRLQVAVDLAHAALVAEEAEHESFRLQIAALQARLAAVHALADDAESGKTGTTMRSFLGPAAYVSTSELRRALDGPADPGRSEASDG